MADPNLSVQWESYNCDSLITLSHTPPQYSEDIVDAMPVPGAEISVNFVDKNYALTTFFP